MSGGEEPDSIFSISTEPEDSNNDQFLYHKAYSIVPEDNEPASKRLRARCFNCGVGQHNMSECPEKYDRQAVMKNRAAFQFQRQSQPGFSNSREFKRYHIELENQVKAEVVPGSISDKLREALGISKNQLPPYIYKMRELGYPPGWLEEATLSHSGINMINTSGERVPDPDEEEGEIFVAKTKYDFSKIIDYPGYNVWPSPDTVNETDQYCAPPMLREHSKISFIEFLKSQMEKDEDLLPTTVGVDMSIDMDMEEVEDGLVIEGHGEFLPPLPAERPPDVPPPPPSPLLEPDKEENEEGEIEPKARPLRGVKRSSENMDEPTVIKSPRSSLLLDSVHSEAGGRDPSPSRSPNSPDPEGCTTPDQSLDSSFGRVIAIENGTPALKLHSPFTNLPSSEAFRKDITDVINFENLPNSTGKYEKLKGVLKKVREKLNIFRGNK